MATTAAPAALIGRCAALTFDHPTRRTVPHPYIIHTCVAVSVAADDGTPRFLGLGHGSSVAVVLLPGMVRWHLIESYGVDDRYGNHRHLLTSGPHPLSSKPSGPKSANPLRHCCGVGKL